jgi:hypothetical protein
MRDSQKWKNHDESFFLEEDTIQEIPTKDKTERNSISSLNARFPKKARQRKKFAYNISKVVWGDNNQTLPTR